MHAMQMLDNKVSLQMAGAVRIKDRLRVSGAAGHKETLLGFSISFPVFVNAASLSQNHDV